MAGSNEEKINDLTTTVAVIQNDISYLKSESGLHTKQQESIFKAIQDQKNVSIQSFEKVTKEIDDRIKAIEKYQADMKPGVNFANLIVSKWTTMLVLLVIISAIVAMGSKFISLGGK